MLVCTPLAHGDLQFEHYLDDTRRKIGAGYFKESYRYPVNGSIEVVVRRDWDSPFAWYVVQFTDGWDEHYPYSDGKKPVYTSREKALEIATQHIAHIGGI